MKKFLLSLIALFGVVSANAQVTETDRTAYDDAIYAQSLTVLKGVQTVDLTINVKSHTNFTAVEFFLRLPNGATVVDLNKIEQGRRRYVKTSGSDVYEYNEMADGSYKIVGTATCDRGFAAGDDAFSYVTINVAGLEVGEYPIVVKEATISGFINSEDGVSTGEADAFLADEITTTLKVTNSLVFNEEDEILPIYAAGSTADVQVKRTLKANQWGTICLPFAMTQEQVKASFGDGVIFATFDSWSITDYDEETLDIAAITVNFKKQSAIQAKKGIAAGTPYLVKPSSDVSVIEVENVQLVDAIEDVVAKENGDWEDNAKLVGTFVKTKVPEKCAFLSGNKFYYSVGKTNMKGFRAWFDFGDDVLAAYFDGAEAKMNYVVEDETITAIDGVNIDSNGAVYTIDGKFVGRDVNQKKLQKGIYIIDGKKVAIK